LGLGAGRGVRLGAYGASVEAQVALLVVLPDSVRKVSSFDDDGTLYVVGHWSDVSLGMEGIVLAREVVVRNEV
jgi:hypothetical protein